MTAQFSILVMIARYQGPHNGGGVACTSQVLEYDTKEQAQGALAALVKSHEVRAMTGSGSGRFVVDALPLWN